jgi:hypothetical protein
MEFKIIYRYGTNERIEWFTTTGERPGPHEIAWIAL